MPLYLRRSVRAGPFRFNFSQSGVGVSVGVRGLRIGTGPRGHYIRAGRGDISYSATIGHAGERKPAEPPTVAPRDPHPSTYQTSGVTMVEVSSGDVLAMRDEAFANVLDEINAKQNLARLSIVLLCSFVIAGIGLAYLVEQAGLVLVALALPAWAVGKWMDTYRRATVMLYDLGEDARKAFENMTEGFDALRRCDSQWHIEAGGAVRDTTTWKRNAGASHIIKRKPATLEYRLPTVVRSNVTPPMLRAGRHIIYFFPDVALVQTGNRFGAVGYADLRLRRQPSHFIEDGRVPKDAHVVSHTWQHPNKKGGPDRRFRNNRQLPVCLYDALHISSESGVNELVEFSQPEASASFASALLRLPRQSASDLVTLPQQAICSRVIDEKPTQIESATVLPDVVKATPPRTEQKRLNGSRVLLAVCLATGFGIGAALILDSRRTTITPITPTMPVALTSPSIMPRAPEVDVTGSIRAAVAASHSNVQSAPATPAKRHKHVEHHQ